jgi:TonB-dependent receptor
LTTGSGAWAQTTPASPAEGAQGSVAAGGTQATTPQEESDDVADVVVTGIRASLQGAQDIKRNATAVVDSIVAEDIGKFPDNTVSDALQRVTGIQVARGGGEVNSVLVRGLPNVETLINGREVFTGTGRGVQLQDIPAELVAGVDVYKTTTSDQIEGSVSGTIDIRLRRPLDFDTGFTLAGGGRAFYSDKRDKWSYVGSGLISNRWTTSGGQEFGILIGGSYNDRKYRDQTAFNFGFNPLSAADPTLIPDTVGGLVTDGNRQRPAVNASFQWKPNPDLEIFADALYTGYRQNYDVNFFVGLPKAGAVTVNTRRTGTVGFDEPSVPNRVLRPVAGTITTRDNFTITSKQAFDQVTDGYQFNVGTRFNAGDAVVSTEFTYSKSDVFSRAIIVDTAFVIPRVDYNFDVGGTPSIAFNGFNVTNGANFNLLTLFDQRNEAHSDQYAWRGDVTYNIDGGFLKNLKFGARYALREGDSAAASNAPYGLNFTPVSGFAGIITNAPGDIIGGALGVDGFALPSTDYINTNLDRLRALAGRPAGAPPFDPPSVFSLRESVYAAYAQVQFGNESEAFTGTLGARLVNTVTTLDAIQVTNLPTGPVLSPTTGRRNELNILPTLTLKFRPMEDVVLRAVAGKAIFRPQFAELNPAISLTPTSITGGSTAFGTGAGGNPDLAAVKSDNVDVTAEWYMSSTGSITVAGFYKKLSNYIQTSTSVEPQVAAGGGLQNFLITRPRNTASGELKGVEIAATQFLDFLPGALGGFGAQASFTYADGSLTDAAGVERAITPLSKYSYNLVGIYEKYGFSARLAYNWRSSYTDSYSAVVPDGRIVVKPLSFLDFSASYAINDAITLTIDATNLLDEKYQDSFGTSGITPRDTRLFDRTFGAGVRVRL